MKKLTLFLLAAVLLALAPSGQAAADPNDVVIFLCRNTGTNPSIVGIEQTATPPVLTAGSDCAAAIKATLNAHFKLKAAVGVQNDSSATAPAGNPATHYTFTKGGDD